MRKNLFFVLLALCSVKAVAQRNGGMWIPTELNEKEMKSLGMKISAADIFNTTRPGIKDAVVQFNGGCTGEIISGQGLVLTNHHCGFGAIQKHSSVQNDLLSNGFWAANLGAELPNPGMRVDFVTDIKDVTNTILNGTEGVQVTQAAAAVKRNIAAMQQAFKGDEFHSLVIKPMYAGNKYYAFTVETFRDIRLVGAPPQSIGKFGSDTDNWVWPRHTGDFSMFRIYAGKDNKPANYSPGNVPYKPKYFLPISVKEVKEGDFTFVFGYPGTTTEYLPAIAIEKLVKDVNPARIAVRDAALKTLDEKMRTDDATRIKYASKYASVANYWKKWIGETKGLQKSNAAEKRRAYEKTLADKNAAVAATLQQMEALYNQQAPYALNRAYYSEVTRNAESLDIALKYAAFLRDYKAGKTDTSMVKGLAGTYADYDGTLDARVTGRLVSMYADRTTGNTGLVNMFKNLGPEASTAVINRWSAKSVITGRRRLNGVSAADNVRGVFANGKALAAALQNDSLLMLAENMQDNYMKNTLPAYADMQQQIDDLQKTYMRQQMETDKSKVFFPDANSTLRVTYGQVKGSDPADAIHYNYQTTLDGVMEKYVPGDYEFDVPARLIELYKRKDYGPYADANGKVPVNFTATNHTTGGNSGSPALDANGNLVGLNFDRQWEGTMSDVNYDPRFSRNIMVNTKYILFIIDKYAGAKRLLAEMKIVK